MTSIHDKRFPGESKAYRLAREALLAEEMELRRKMESVAEFRRKLPLGGRVNDDYTFVEGDRDLRDETTETETRFSELFEPGKGSLIVYSFMFPAENELPCPMCNAILDGLNGNAPHIQQRVNFAVVAKAPIGKIRAWARQRDWRNLRLLSSAKSSFNADYHAEDPHLGQMPAVNVFVKRDSAVHHYYNSELLYAPTEQSQHPRHADLFWPLWNLFDLTPDGRGSGWLPQFSYDIGCSSSELI